MSVFLSKGGCQKLDMMCSVVLNSPTFTSVNYVSYFRGATRIIQAGRICSSESPEGKLNTLTGNQFQGGVHQEPRRCVANQAAVHTDQPGASFLRLIPLIHRRPNGVVHGSFLFTNAVQAATMAANQFCNREIDKGEGGHHGATLCFLSSFDYLKYVRPFDLINVSFVKANVNAASDHLLQVEVFIGLKNPSDPGAFELANSAQLTFITSDHHDFSQKYNITRQKSHAGDLGDSQPLQPIPSKVKDVDHTKSNISTLIPDSSFVSFIQPYNSMPPQHAFCQPEHVCKLMEEHGIILASRLTQHDVVCVHVGPVTFQENIRIGSVVATWGEVISTAGDVLTVFQTVHLLFDGSTKTQKRCVAEGLFSYVPINSSKERVSISGHQVLSRHGGKSFVQDKEIGIEYNIVDSYVNDLKNL